MKKRFLIALALLLFLSTYNINSNLKFFFKLNIEQVDIENISLFAENQITQNLNFLYQKNLIFLNKKEIEDVLKKIDYIDSFEIKKIYPRKIIIRIYEKTPIAILHNRREKFYYTDKSDLISFSNIEKFKNLPVVIGDRDNFTLFYNLLKEINFPISDIKTLRYYKSKRWDLVTKKNKVVKLPVENYDKSLKNFLSINHQDNFEMYNTFDYRINNQLILK